jgi:hypothetical protein
MRCYIWTTPRGNNVTNDRPFVVLAEENRIQTDAIGINSDVTGF